MSLINLANPREVYRSLRKLRRSWENQELVFFSIREKKKKGKSDDFVTNVENGSKSVT